jgi:glycosyltransferase involved in cell wall biosynthesis
MTRVETMQSGNPYFLYVGTIGPRKNIETVITAWRAIRAERKVDLVLAGRLAAEQSPDSC